MSNVRKDWARSRQSQFQTFSASAVFEAPVEDLHAVPDWLRDAMGENELRAHLFHP
jgi:hypothetical protein